MSKFALHRELVVVLLKEPERAAVHNDLAVITRRRRVIRRCGNRGEAGHKDTRLHGTRGSGRPERLRETEELSALNRRAAAVRVVPRHHEGAFAPLHE